VTTLLSMQWIQDKYWLSTNSAHLWIHLFTKNNKQQHTLINIRIQSPKTVTHAAY